MTGKEHGTCMTCGNIACRDAVAGRDPQILGCVMWQSDGCAVIEDEEE